MATVPTFQQVENVLIKYGLDPRSRADITLFLENLENDPDAGAATAAQRAAEQKREREAGGEDNKSASALLDAYFDNLKKAKQFEPAAAREKDRSKMSAAELLDLAFDELKARE